MIQGRAGKNYLSSFACPGLGNLHESSVLIFTRTLSGWWCHLLFISEELVRQDDIWNHPAGKQQRRTSAGTRKRRHAMHL